MPAEPRSDLDATNEPCPRLATGRDGPERLHKSGVEQHQRRPGSAAIAVRGKVIFMRPQVYFVTIAM
jgi:hypothetical protein